ncbi:MAG: hypothetical protein IPJ60_07570 [Sphingobacteriaceae bacterium]|nr:hypothetical protein [Sphingobacteriaceae bacterium]
MDNKCITCVVEDNGVGRLGKMRLLETSSLAMEFIKKRLDIINELRDSGCGFKIIDKQESTNSETGTIVIVKIPIMNT